MLGLSTAVIKDMSDPGLHTLIISLKKRSFRMFSQHGCKVFQDYILYNVVWGLAQDVEHVIY